MSNMALLVRREFWEQKFLVVTLQIVAGLLIFGFVLSFVTMVATGTSFKGAVAALELAGAPVSMTGGGALLGVTAGMLNIAMAAVIFFYCLDALHGERKDRSILFWRSLPVTDTETVLSKALTAVVFVPLLAFGITIATHIVLLVLASIAIVLGSGNPIELLWSPLPFLQFWLMLGYTMIVTSLWFAPVIAWLLLCSAYARRSVLVWAALPPIIAIMLESIVLRSSHIATMIGNRFAGAMPEAFALPNVVVHDPDQLQDLVMNGSLDLMQTMTPVNFLLSPGLWGGLIVAAAFLAGAVYFRRLRA